MNAVSEGGQTPLHLAAFHGKARETLQLLFSRPELRSAGKNAQGDTPRDIAARQGCTSKDIFGLRVGVVRDNFNTEELEVKAGIKNPSMIRVGFRDFPKMSIEFHPKGKCCLRYFEGDLLSEAVTRVDEET